MVKSYCGETATDTGDEEEGKNIEWQEIGIVESINEGIVCLR